MGTADVEADLLTKNGLKVPYYLLGTRFITEGKQCIVGTGIDISSKKRSEEQYRSLFQESKDVIFITTPEGKIIEMNPAGLELFGYSSKDDFPHIDLDKDLYCDQRDRVKYRNVLEQNGFVKDYQLDLKRKDGKEVTVLVTSTVLHNEDGNALLYRGIMRDITEYKRLETQLLQAQKMEVVGQLAGGIAHDFNNILCAISGYGSLIHMKMNKEDPLREYIKQILESVDRAADLTHGLLAFSRKQIMHTRPVDIKETIRKFEKLVSSIIGEDYRSQCRLQRPGCA